MSLRPICMTAALAVAVTVLASWSVQPAQAGEPYLDRLVQTLLYAHDDDDREDAAEDLGKLRDPRALPALRQAAVYDSEDDVRDEARKAIYRTDYRRPAAPPIIGNDLVGHLTQILLYAGDEDDREEAAERLGKLRDPRALPALEQAAIYDTEDDVRDEAGDAARDIRRYSPAAWPFTCQPGHVGHNPATCPRRGEVCNTCHHDPCTCHKSAPQPQCDQCNGVCRGHDAPQANSWYDPYQGQSYQEVPQTYLPGQVQEPQNDGRFVDPRYSPPTSSYPAPAPDNYVNLGPVPNYNYPTPTPDYRASVEDRTYYAGQVYVDYNTYTPAPVYTPTTRIYTYRTPTTTYCPPAPVNVPRVQVDVRSRSKAYQAYVNSRGGVSYRQYEYRYPQSSSSVTRYTRTGYPYTTRDSGRRDRDDCDDGHSRDRHDRDRDRDRDHHRR